MKLLPVVLLLATVLFSSFPANGEDPTFSELSTTIPAVQTEIVNKHNEIRRSVSPPASNMLKMEWNSDAAVNAQRWANECTFKHSAPETRTIGLHCGENLYMSKEPIYWSEAIQNWANESFDFTHGVGPHKHGDHIGHYTQAVWYSSYYVGCGIAYCPNEEWEYYFVCQYCPAGNDKHRKNFPYDIGEPCASCPGYCDNGLCTNRCDYDNYFGNCAHLMESADCDNEVIKENCKASCHCPDKIY
ncbi:cysteine-rich secretory protein 2-like [Tamandua tetradactyla]|uniref:cysteine-rich secretory protein 2-like n=1 Tax=Tamandua tetradactyla TaxID=48850 RepID=UPI004054863D